MTIFRTGHLAALTALLSLYACGRSPEGTAEAPAPPPPEVIVEVVAPEKLTLTSELPGRVQARRTAEVRARVEGIVEHRLYQEGSEVAAGDPLFQIDPAHLKTAVASAEATLARARADARQAELKAERFGRLAGGRAVSKQDYDEAVALAKQAAADVALADAQLARTRLDLGYARVTAPIAGRIGRALVTEGALVGRDDATHLATIEQLDPVYVNFTQSSRDLLDLRKRYGFGTATGVQDPQVIVKMENGAAYSHPGTLLFSEMTVDPGTGEVLLRALVPNPERVLLPGMFVRVMVEQAVIEQAITVSQRALMRTAEGAAVMTVDAAGKVRVHPVTADRAIGDRWLVTEGLAPGDQVIVEGLQKVRPDMPATPRIAGAGAAGPDRATH